MDFSLPKHGNMLPNVYYILYSVGLGKFVRYVFLTKIAVQCLIFYQNNGLYRGWNVRNLITLNCSW